MINTRTEPLEDFYIRLGVFKSDWSDAQQAVFWRTVAEEYRREYFRLKDQYQDLKAENKEEKMKVTTESGSIYEFENGYYSKNGVPFTKVRRIRQGSWTENISRSGVFDMVAHWDDITLSEAFETGKNLFIEGIGWNEWWLTTPIQKVEK